MGAQIMIEEHWYNRRGARSEPVNAFWAHSRTARPTAHVGGERDGYFEGYAARNGQPALVRVPSVGHGAIPKATFLPHRMTHAKKDFRRPLPA